MQLVLQAPAEQMSSLAQTWAAGAVHVPPLQTLWPTKLVPEQVGPVPQLIVGYTQALELLQLPAQLVPTPAQSALMQQPDEATQSEEAAHFLGRELPQVKPQLVPSQVAVLPVGVGQAVHEEPHDPVLVLDAHTFPQAW